MNLFITFAIFSALTISSVKPDWFRLYDDIYQQGWSTREDAWAQCINLHPEFNDRASSVNTEGNCIRLYEHTNCGGREVTFAPGTPSHGDFRELNFNDMASSYRVC